MTKTIKNYFKIILLFSLPFQISAQKKGTSSTFNIQRLQKVDDLIDGFIKNVIAPNAVTYVVQNGQVVHHKAFGYRNLETKTLLKKDDIFRIASQTKLITTVALLTYFEEGKFLLNDPISKYIPAFKNPQVLVSVDSLDKTKFKVRPAKSEITIKQLLSHTAGIPYDHPLGELEQFKVPFFNSLKADKLEDVVNKLAKRPLTSDPGELYTYGLNTDIIGRLVEIIAQKPLDQVFKDRIFNPIGMKDTYFYLPKDKQDRLVELYSKGTEQETLTLHKNNDFRNFAKSGAQTYFSGGAGLLSTVEDYGKFCLMLLNNGNYNGKQIISRKTVEMIQQNAIGDNFVWTRKDKFGLGVEITSPESTFMELTTPGAYGWGGMYCSDYVIDEKENMVLLVFTNVHPYAHFEEFVKKFRVTVYQALK